MLIQKLSRNKFLILLIGLLTFFILNPLLVNNRAKMVVFGLLFSIVVLFSIYIIKRGKILIICALIFAFAVILGYWSNRILQLAHEIHLIVDFLIVLFFLFISVIVISYVSQDIKVDLNTLCGAVCGYLLMGLSFSFFYIFMVHINPLAFNIPYHNSSSFESQTQTFVYFSFVTQSTVGYGDIVPISNLARTFSWLQAVTGQVYLTVWIAHLVGLHIARKSRAGAD